MNLRYDGTDVAVMTTCSSSCTYEEAFENTYKREFGFVLEDRSIQVGVVCIMLLDQSLECSYSRAFLDVFI